MDIWLEVKKCQLEKVKLPEMVKEAQLKIPEELSEKYTGKATTQVVEVGRNGGVVTQQMEYEMFLSVLGSFRQKSMLFFENMALRLPEQFGSGKDIAPAYKKLGDLSLPATAPLPMEDVKSHVVVEEVYESGVKLSSV